MTATDQRDFPRPIKLTLPSEPTPGHPDPFKPDGPMTVDPGARLTLAVTAPLTPGTYYLVDNYTLANLPYFDLRRRQLQVLRAGHDHRWQALR